MPSPPHACANPLCKKVTYGTFCRNCFQMRRHQPKPVTVNARDSWWLNSQSFYQTAKQQVERMQAAQVWTKGQTVD